MKIYKYNNELEAQKIKLLFAEQNIPCELRSFENWGYNGLFRGQIGMGEVIVPDEFTDKAKGIIDKFVKEERDKPLEIDIDLAHIVLKRNIGSLNAFIWLIFISFIIIGSFLLFRISGIISIVVVVMLAICTISAINRLQNALKNTKEKLEKIEKAK